MNKISLETSVPCLILFGEGNKGGQYTINVSGKKHNGIVIVNRLQLGLRHDIKFTIYNNGEISIQVGCKYVKLQDLLDVRAQLAGDPRKTDESKLVNKKNNRAVKSPVVETSKSYYITEAGRAYKKAEYKMKDVVKVFKPLTKSSYNPYGWDYQHNSLCRIGDEVKTVAQLDIIIKGVESLKQFVARIKSED